MFEENQDMTAVLDLHPDTGHPAVAGVRAVHDLLDSMDTTTALSSYHHRRIHLRI